MADRRRSGVVGHDSEETEQIYLMNWIESAKKAYPDIEMIFHIPNGGMRSKTEAGRMKASGVKAGVPDLFLPVAKGKYHGLFIEMKVGDNMLRVFERVTSSGTGYYVVKDGMCLVALIMPMRVTDEMVKQLDCLKKLTALALENSSARLSLSEGEDI